MKKPLVALAAGVGVFALTGAAAATLTVTGFVPQANNTTAKCQSGPVTATAVLSGAPFYNVTGVQVSGLNAACDPQELQAVVYGAIAGGAAPYELSEAVIISSKVVVVDGVRTVTVDLVNKTAFTAKQIENIDVVIAGVVAPAPV
jgi:hypothetical protein